MFKESNVYCRPKYRSKLAKENEKPTIAIYYVDQLFRNGIKTQKRKKYLKKNIENVQFTIKHID